jgi:CopG-like RHH_1 or ribbon-helix-helix domain, RHH_5
MDATTAYNDTAPMPTKLKRISVALDDEAYAKLEELALGSKRSIANMAAVLIENTLFPGGRALKPRNETRGGKREGSGRPKKSLGDQEDTQEP